jgi:hypothetical protein
MSHAGATTPLNFKELPLFQRFALPFSTTQV